MAHLLGWWRHLPASVAHSVSLLRLLANQVGFCEVEGKLQTAPEAVALASTEPGCVARAFASGVPALTDIAVAEPGSVGASAGVCGANSLVAVPIVSEGVVAEVLALYF